MYKFARKNQKKMMGILCAVLMVTFLAGYSYNRNSNASGRAERPIGTIGTEKIFPSDLTRSTAEWRLLLQHPFARHGSEDIYLDIFARNSEGGERPSLAAGILGNGDTPQIVDGQEYFSNLRAGEKMTREINGDPTAFLLLVRDARKQGIAVTADAVEQVMVNSVQDPPTDEDEAAGLRIAIADLLAVRQSLDRAADTVKVSQPMVNRVLALQRQSVTLRVVLVPAEDFLPTAKAPTTQAVQEQYDHFGDRLPDQWEKPAADDPFCFGYAIPNRVQFQYIRLKRGEALAAVQASKSDLDWMKEAFLEFQSRRDYYDSQPLPLPSTQPALNLEGAVTKSADTRPTTAPTAQARKVDDIGQDFVLHSSLARKAVFDREADKLMDLVVQSIASKMAADFAAFHNAQIAKTENPLTSLGVTYDDKDYIPRLVDTLDAQFKVHLGHLESNRWNTAAELNDMTTGIESAVIGDRDSPDVGMSFAEYATTRAVPFQTDPSKPGPDALELWAPSPMLVDFDRDSYQIRAEYIARITAADVSHAPPLSEVRRKIDQDVVLASAYAQAKTQAQKVFDRAKTDGLATAAHGAKLSIQTTDPIAPLNSRERPTVAPLTLKPESNVFLAVAAFKLISAPSSPGHPPMALVDLYPDAEVAIIELDGLKPDYTADSQNMVQAGIRRELDTELRQQVELGWLIPTDIATRVGFKAADKSN